jgi:UMF1 family MFS transporter
MNKNSIVRSWAYYDFANSSYILSYGAFLLPAYFATVLINFGYPLAAWGTANAIATFLGILLALWLGKISDKYGKYRFLKWTIILSSVGMIVLGLATSFSQTLVAPLFILTQAIFIASLSLSDSVLPHISQGPESYRYSGFAWGFGYVGGILSLLIVLIIQSQSSEFSLPVFLSVSIFYTFFSGLALKGLKSFSALPASYEESVTLTRKQKIQFLLGFWIISECITVFILFFALYCSKELGLTSMQIGYMLLLIQLVAFPATLIGGRLAAKGKMATIFSSSMICMLVAFVLLLLPPYAPTVILISILGGLAVGNSQSILRAHYARVVKPENSGTEFGFYSFVSQAAVIIGPILYGWSSDSLESQKIPLIVLTALMLVGFLIVLPIMRKKVASKSV